MIATARTYLSLTARLLRLLAAVLALACQISGGALAYPSGPPDSIALLDAVTVFCQAPKHAGQDKTPPAHHQLVEAAVASASHHCAPPVALLATTTTPPLPYEGRAARGGLPAARAPPCRFAAAWSARGPPTLL